MIDPTAYINKSPLDNIDKSKVDQLDQQQKSIIQGSTVDQAKALNKKSFTEWRNLTSTSLRNYINTLKVDKLGDVNDQLNKIKDDSKKKLQQLRNVNDPKSFLKFQNKIDAKTALSAATAIVVPLLTQFINAERVANSIVNKLINDSRKQLRNKGSFIVVNGAITFTPLDSANYQRYKDNFDRRVKNLKNIVRILKQIIDTLLVVLRIVRVA